jgi:hypothetical protein
MLHNWSRYTRENSPRELSILLCIFDSREYLAHLHALENEAKAAKRGGWGVWSREVLGDHH